MSSPNVNEEFEPDDLEWNQRPRSLSTAVLAIAMGLASQASTAVVTAEAEPGTSVTAFNELAPAALVPPPDAQRRVARFLDTWHVGAVSSAPPHVPTGDIFGSHSGAGDEEEGGADFGPSETALTGLREPRFILANQLAHSGTLTDGFW